MSASVFSESADAKGGIASMEQASFSERLHHATWKSERPYEAMTALLAEVGSESGADSLKQSLQFAELALRLRAPDALIRSRTMLEPNSANPWALWMLAELDHLDGHLDSVRQRFLDLRRSHHDLPIVLRTRFLRLASRVDPALLDEFAQYFGDDESLDSILYHWSPHLRPEHPAMRRYVARLSQHAQIDEGTAADVLAFMQGLECPTNLHTEWTDPEATDPGWLAGLLGRIETAKAHRTGLSIIRLGDGDGAFLQGGVGHLVGAVGHLPDGKYRHLDTVEFERVRTLLSDAIEHADVCAVPDVRYLLNGPPRGPKVAQWFLGRPESPVSLVAGPVYLGFDLEALGLSRRLASQATGIIGPADPATMNLLSASPLNWLRVPGDKHFTGAVPSTESHFHDYFDRILEYPFEAGQVWLVGAGVLGKIYCEAIRQRGAVAVDVGAAMDLWAGRPDTRHPGRLHPWLAGPHRSNPTPSTA